MSQANNQIKWCLKKAEEELKTNDKHRGLIITKPNIKLARDYINKADHYLAACDILKNHGFSDISASTLFYAIYHSLLAIAAKFGYESRNQSCTFALIYSFVEDKKIEFDKEILEKIAKLDKKDYTLVEIREEFQYGTKLSMEKELFDNYFQLAKKVIAIGKEILEE
jgi:uncharacterized protein (UPF0332 family)